MPIIVNLDVQLAIRKMSLNELSRRLGLNPTAVSIIKTGKARAIRFSTLEAICRALNCKPGDILDYQPDQKNISDEQGYDNPGTDAGETL